MHQYCHALAFRQRQHVLANGIHSAASGFIAPSEWPPIYALSILVDFVIGSCVIWIASLLKSGETRDRIIAVLGSVVPFYVLYEFYSSNVWLGSIPVVAGVCIERLHAKYEKLEKTIKNLEQENKQLRAAPAELQVRVRDRQVVKFANGTVAEEIVEREEAVRRSPPKPGLEGPSNDSE